eukprot:scaffold251714_cov27-Tisochrysis_lutea.AAC.2
MKGKQLARCTSQGPTAIIAERCCALACPPFSSHSYCGHRRASDAIDASLATLAAMEAAAMQLSRASPCGTASPDHLPSGTASPSTRQWHGNLSTGSVPTLRSRRSSLSAASAMAASVARRCPRKSTRDGATAAVAHTAPARSSSRRAIVRSATLSAFASPNTRAFCGSQAAGRRAAAAKIGPAIAPRPQSSTPTTSTPEQLAAASRRRDGRRRGAIAAAAPRRPC